MNLKFSQPAHTYILTTIGKQNIHNRNDGDDQSNKRVKKAPMAQLDCFEALLAGSRY